MSLQLVCIKGTATPNTIPINDQVDIGRDPHCDVRIDDDACSRYHAQLSIDGTQLILQDNNSSNGTFFKDKRISKVSLDHNDQFRCGTCVFAIIDTASKANETRIISDGGTSVGLSHSIETQVWEDGDDVHQLSIIHHVCRELAATEQSERAEKLMRAVKNICHPDHYGLASRGALLEGNMSERLCLRLAVGKDARLFVLGADLHGQTIAEESIGSACCVPLGEGSHIVVARGADKDAFTQQHLSLLSQLAADAHVYFPTVADHLEQDIVGESKPIRALRARIHRLAQGDSTILITGPSGTGKELVAKNLHHLSGRHLGPFIAVNCGAIADQLFEAELFGHVKGAFTGATQNRDGKIQAADGGTLFLDEIGELSLDMQVKLLRVLQEKKVTPVGSHEEQDVHFRVIAATNRDLHAEVAAGHFREDLFYRLDVLRVHTPPLSERREDIPLLAQALLQRLCEAEGRPCPLIEADASKALAAAAWPGNVRQLENIMHRALVMAEHSIRAEDLDLEISEDTAESSDEFLSLAELEAQHIKAALARCNGNKSEAARLLGISRPTIHKKIGDYGLE